MYYVSWDWHVKSPGAGPTIEPLMLLTAPWRLSLLFLVSGAATAFLIGKSASGFLGARSWRLLVPLAFGMLVVVVPQAYYEVVAKMPGGYHDGYLAFWGRYRSEEHTSELQSLMRISYAVICLTKENIAHTNQSK